LTQRNLYQRLYEDPNINYGRAADDRCPGTRYFPKYRYWLHGRVIDLGCGTGDTVSLLRQNGYEADGIDQVSLDNGMKVGDITQPLDLADYGTAVCIDVLEHIPDKQLAGLWANLVSVFHQVLTTYSGPSHEIGYPQNLHPNIKTPSEWMEVIAARLTIRGRLELRRKRWLWFCESR